MIPVPLSADPERAQRAVADAGGRAPAGRPDALQRPGGGRDRSTSSAPRSVNQSAPSGPVVIAQPRLPRPGQGELLDRAGCGARARCGRRSPRSPSNARPGRRVIPLGAAPTRRQPPVLRRQGPRGARWKWSTGTRARRSRRLTAGDQRPRRQRVGRSRADPRRAGVIAPTVAIGGRPTGLSRPRSRRVG